jgi:beta-galactosidase
MKNLTIVVFLCVFSVSLNGQVTKTGEVKMQDYEVRVQNYKDLPTLMINGKPDAGMTYMTYRPNEKYFRDFGIANVPFVSFKYVLDRSWISRDSMDFSAFDSNVEMILKANPKALIFPRVYLFAPKWWMDENPDELMVYHDGEKFKPTRGWRNGTTLPAWSSEKWREDTGYNLQMFIKHIKEQEWGSHIVGYHLASGGTDEWYYYCYYNWFFNDPQVDFLDYSIPQTSAFRVWLKKKYSTVENLRNAWYNDTVTFDKATIASKADKQRTTLYLLYDPALSQHVIDSWDFESEVIAETIGYFCRVVKEETSGKAFTGAFYGYIIGANDKGYCSTGHLLKNAYIDFLTAPSGYSFREPGNGYSNYRTPVRSVQLAGKLWWDENDYYTYLTPASSWVEGWTGPRDLNTTINQQIRQLATQIHHGVAGWWFDMSGGWYNSPEAMEMINKLNKIASKSVNFDRGSLAEVAVVIDEKSLLYLGMENELYSSLIMEQPLEIGRMGTPVDWILVDDIGKSDQYKMYVMLNLLHVTDQQKKSISELQNGGAKSILWVYAPGLMTNKVDVPNCKNLTGINLKLLNDKSPLQIEINDAGNKYFPSLYKGFRYGTQYKIAPVMAADDPTVQVLGTIYGMDEAGLVYKNINGVQTYYSASTKLSGELLRAIALKSDVHIYNDTDDGTYVNKSFMSIHTVRGGERTLSFLRPVNLYDVYNDKVIANNAKQVVVDLPVRNTALYFLGTKKEWESSLPK